MIVKNVRVTRTPEFTELRATCKLRQVGWDEIYFRVSGKQGEYVFDDASAFAAALMIPAMKLGQDLIIHGSISEQLHNSLPNVQTEVMKWNVGLKRIQVKADAVTPDTHKPTRTSTFFSGGVDSFYTYLKHRTDEKLSDRVDSFFLVKGFDIDPRNQDLWNDTYANIKAIGDAENIELVVIETNIHGLLKPIILWDYSHGGCLAAVGLFLRGSYRTIYIPSTFSVAEQLPWGSHMDVDPLWSTEQTHFFHDGTEATRMEKVLWQVAKSPLALKHLRVCYMNERGRYNCGVCDKCVRTMISLYAAGVLDQAETFPHTIDLNLVRRAPVDRGKYKKIFHAENQNIAALKAADLDPELQAAIEFSKYATISRQKQLRGSLMRRYIALETAIIYLDFAYTRGNLYRQVAKVIGRKF